MMPVTSYLALSAAMFAIGAAGFIVRRNAIVVLMCIELMLNAVNVAFAAISTALHGLDGQVAVFFVMVVAAAEAAVGLAVVISVFRVSRTLDTDKTAQLKG